VHDPFFTTKAVGVGMGLAMAVRAAEEHEGVLRMESRPGLHTRAIMEFREVRR
jgi:nitrogen-specific signal transduction histidine kinase